MKGEHPIPSNADALLMADRDQKIIVANAAVSSLFGYDVEEVVNRRTDFLFSVLPGDDAPSQGLADILAQSGFAVRKAAGRRKDGSTLSLEVISSVLPGSGATVHLLRPAGIRRGTGVQETGPAPGEAYQSLFDEVSDAVLHLDMEWNIRGANRAAEALFGIPSTGLRGMTIIQIHPRESFDRIFTFFKEVVQTGHSALGDVYVQRGEGGLAAVRIAGSLIRFDGAMVVQLLYRREGAEEGRAKKPSEAQVPEDVVQSAIRPHAAGGAPAMTQDPGTAESLSDLFESAPEPIWSVDTSLRITSINSAFTRLFFLLYGAELKEGMPLLECVHPPFRRVIAWLFNAAVKGSCLSAEQVLGEGGMSVELEILSSPLYDSAGAVTGVAFYARRISRAGQGARHAEVPPDDRDILLKEAYHRVKNNLQLAASLLNFQAEQIKDPQYLEMFRESQNRIRSMALIHEKLYESQDLKSVDFGDYLRILMNNLQWSYGANARGVRLKLDVGQVSMHPKAAVHCGLIINELVSNSFKHAFSGGSGGQISVSLQHDPLSGYRLTVSDDGIGFPADLDFRNTKSLGMQLVAMLTEQLKGTITLDRSKGTSFTIAFT